MKRKELEETVELLSKTIKNLRDRILILEFKERSIPKYKNGDRFNMISGVGVVVGEPILHHGNFNSTVGEYELYWNYAVLINEVLLYYQEEILDNCEKI